MNAAMLFVGLPVATYVAYRVVRAAAWYILEGTMNGYWKSKSGR